MADPSDSLNADTSSRVQWVFDSIAGMELEDERKYPPGVTMPLATPSKPGLEAASTQEEDEDDAYEAEGSALAAKDSAAY